LSIRDHILEKLRNKFNFESSMAEFQLLTRGSILTSFKFWLNKLGVDGEMDYKQCLRLLKEIGLNLPNYEANQLVRQSDHMNRGTINATQFSNLVDKFKMIDYPESTAEFMKIFSIIDEDKTG